MHQYTDITISFKLQTKKVVEKVTKWREAVVKLKRDIPSDDEVLCSWIAKIEDFGIDLPLLLEMSSVSLKVIINKYIFLINSPFPKMFRFLYLTFLTPDFDLAPQF